MPQCSAYHCRNRGVHLFPKDLKRRKQWESALRIKNFRASATARLCSLHFRESDYFGKSNYTGNEPLAKFLRKTAVPSIFCFTKTKPETPAAKERQCRYERRSKKKKSVEEIDPKNENNTHSNLAACWKSATGEVQHDDQPGSKHSALYVSDTDDYAGSSDDDNIQEPSPPPQLNLHTAQMCRVCLALDVKMFDLRDTELKTMFQMTTGITFEENKGSEFGSLICWQCAARLQAASRFKRKALFSDSLLQGLKKKGNQIQKQYFESVKEEADSFIPPKILTVAEIVHIVEIEDQNNMTQLVQSGDDDEPSLSENDETDEIMTYEIKEQIIDEKSKMDVKGDKDVAIKTGIKQKRTKILKEYALDRSSIEGTINYSRPLLDIGHTSLRSDLTSSQEDCNDLISKSLRKTYKNSKIVRKRHIELKNSIKRSKLGVSHDHVYS